ncbi:MAG: hypothetical protein WC467_04035 [Patescibacteria group bacterium]
MGERNGIENYFNNLVKEKQEEDAKLGKNQENTNKENVMTEEKPIEQRPQEKDGDLFDQKI